MTAARWVGAMLLVGTVAGPAMAQPSRKKQIDEAIDRGVAYIRANPWDEKGVGLNGHGIGPVALAGIALLECGVPANDPFVVQMAQKTREAALTEGRTYQLSLCVMFLDLLGEFNDDPLIQVLSIRLMLGQDRATGGWSYQCTFRPPQAEVQRLRAAMPPNARPEDFDLKAEIRHQAELHAALSKQPGGFSMQVPMGGAGDNSNTQFALLALWIAKRHRLPKELVDAVLIKTEARFQRTQFRNGSWGYTPAGLGRGGPGLDGAAGPGGDGTPAMTCAGLLGLAVGHGVRNQGSQLRGTDKPVQGAGGSSKPSGSRGGRVHAQRDPRTDPRIRAGLNILGIYLNSAPRANPRLLTDYYFWFSLERVCVVYGLSQIGGRDWHAMAADVMLRNQQSDGSWRGTNHASIPILCDTCFALLVLKQANLVIDLSKLVGRDKPDAPVPGGTAATPKPGTGTTSGTSTTTAPAATGTDQASKLAADLKQAAGVRLDELLTQYSVGKGNAYTVALARAIPDLSRDGQEKARAALVTRMQRFKASTLNDWLQLREPEYAEVRLACARACVAKNDLVVVPNLIECLADEESAVRSAAHDALRALTRQDFGPAASASATDRDNAIRAWKKWWDKQKR